MRISVVVLLLAVAVADCVPLGAEEQVSHPIPPGEFMAKVYERLTNESHSGVDFILKLVEKHGGPTRMSYEGQVASYSVLRKKSLIKDMLKLFQDMLAWLELQIKNGIAVSQQLLDMVKDAIDMLLSGKMPPKDIIENILLQVLGGLIGRRRRDVEPVVIPATLPLTQGPEFTNEALRYLRAHQEFKTMSTAQQDKATELVQKMMDMLFQATHKD